MTRRRLLLFGLLAGLLALGASAWMLRPLASVITRENAAKIQVGMTLAEVEALPGGPARNDTTGSSLFFDDQPSRMLHEHNIMLACEATPPPMEWYSDRIVIFVVFDPEVHVSACHYLFLRRVDESPLDMLRRRLRL